MVVEDSCGLSTADLISYPFRAGQWVGGVWSGTDLGRVKAPGRRLAGRKGAVVGGCEMYRQGAAGQEFLVSSCWQHRRSMP